MAAIFILVAFAAFATGFGLGATRAVVRATAPRHAERVTEEPAARSGGIMAPCGCEVGGAWSQQCMDHAGLWVEWEIRPVASRRVKASDEMRDSPHSIVVIGAMDDESPRARARSGRPSAAPTEAVS